MEIFCNFGFWMLLTAYFMPTLIALIKKSAAWPACFFVNLFFGWTVLGWFLACGLAYAPTKKEAAYRQRVKEARDDFFLREQEKHGSSA